MKRPASSPSALAFYFYFTVKAMRHDCCPGSPHDYQRLLCRFHLSAADYLSGLCLGLGRSGDCLGLRQTVGESIHGTWMFLLHRPVGWTRLIGVKLLVGVALYLVCGAAAILVYAWWAATPGTHASPFEWSMTVPTWKVWIVMPIVYLGGAFLSGMRPARWVGTRLLAAWPPPACWPLSCQFSLVAGVRSWG